MIIVNILAILFSPIIAVLISIYLEIRREKKKQKSWIFHTLIATRHKLITDENVRALNMIDVAFYDFSSVRKLWHEYFDMLSNEGLNNASGFSQRQKKNLEMITEMAKMVGYKEAITHLDVDRVYSPVGLENQSKQTEEISNELLRVLKESHGIQFHSELQLQKKNIEKKPKVI